MKYVVADLIRGIDRALISPYLCVHRRTYTPLELELESRVEKLFEIPLRIPTRPVLTLPMRIRQLSSNFRGKFDVVHSFDYSSNWPEGATARLAGIPFIMEKTNITWGSMRWWLHAMFSSRIVCLSHIQRNELFKQSGFRRKVVVIHTGIDLDRFSGVRNAQILREEMRLPGNAAVIGCIAKLVRVKGHPELLQAFAQVIKTYPNTYLVIVGGDNPDYEEELQSAANALGIAERVRFLGRRDDVPRLLHAFDGIILATRNWGPKESFGAVLIEGMAAGLPVIATRSGGPEEIVIGGETGWLVEADGIQPLSDAMKELLGDEVRRHCFGQAGRKRAQQLFKKELMIQRYQELYFNVIGSNK